ncbi:MAG: LytTR family DNA-binding domain-containing protein [Burkholderiaceae bacterium]
MQASGPASALIAEDEPLLAAALTAELRRAWPELHVVATAGDGLSAVRLALQYRPDVLFFDIRMPGQSGLEAAADLADQWESDAPEDKPFPALVFVTAYDQYAVQAFESQAVDYLLKPLQPQRLTRTVEKLQRLLAQRSAAAAGASGRPDLATGNLDQTLAQLRALLAGPAVAEGARLSVLQVSVGSTIHMVPLDEVQYFEAADKYVRVLTAEHEYLIRTPLRELLPQLDPGTFWQVHRGTVVRAAAVLQVTRDDSGKFWLQLRARKERLAVSRLYAQQFKAM